jgi:molybdopterin-guanine dinucleotide biosynthesis protein A
MTGADPSSNTTLAVLAGGLGSRMGMPKANLEIRGKPILRHLHDEWGWPGPTLLVTAPGREHPPAYEVFDREVVDPVGGEGPLRGVLTALETVATPLLVVATVDMPRVRLQHLRWLVEQLLSSPASELAIMTNRSLPDGSTQTEPFPCAMRAGVSMLEIVRHRLARGEKSVWRLSQEPGTRIVPAPSHWPADTWVNLNSPEDYQNL